MFARQLISNVLHETIPVSIVMLAVTLMSNYEYYPRCQCRSMVVNV